MLKKILFIIALIPMFVKAQHSIKGTFSPAKDYKYGILYKVTPTNSLFVANTNIDEQGNFEFQLDTTITQGMYRLVYALPQEEYNFDIIYNAKEDIVLAYNAETGVKYQSSIENTLVNSYITSMSLVSRSIGNFFKLESTDSLALASIFKTQQETQEGYEKAAIETIASHFIKASKPYIPKGFEDIKTYINNLKIHFFDDVDFNSEILQSSNFLTERMLNYVFGMPSNNGADQATTFKKNIDDMSLAMKNASLEIKSKLLEILWQQMVDGNFEEVANYISDTYLMEIAKTLNDTELVEGLTLFKYVTIGNKSPEFYFDTEKGKSKKSLYNLDTAKQYAIVFWSSTCSHCLKQMPELHSYLKTLEAGQLQVIAIGLEEEPYPWKNETLNYPEFIHVLGLKKWDNEIGNSYNVTSTPAYYILDKSKTIIARPSNFEAFKKFINRE